MSRPAVIKQPGPMLQPRIVAVETTGRSFKFDIAPGVRLLDGVRDGFAASGFTSGVAELGSVAFSPFAYVMPALSKDGANAAFYSDTYRPSGISRLEAGALTFGLRDGAAFFHCHALWREADNTITGGHILPEETIVAEHTTVTAFGLDAARFEARLDSETNFKIFAPTPMPMPPALGKSSARAIALRLRPNQDFIGALAAAATAHGISHGRIRGGVGSTIGAHFADGTIVENFATEVFIRSGDITPAAAGGLAIAVDAGLVDYTGGMARGRLLEGANPILMTFELVIEVLATP